MSSLVGPAAARRSWIGIIMVGVATHGIAADYGEPNSGPGNVSTKLEIPSAIGIGTVRTPEAS